MTGSTSLFRCIHRAIAASLVLLLAACVSPPTSSDTALYTQVSAERVYGQTKIPVYSFKVLRTLPHDTSSYTEGLVMNEGTL